MPLDKFVLILVIAIAGASLTVWLAVLIGASLSHPIGFAILIPLAPVAYVVWRVIAQRLASREDDHYDRTPR